MDAANYSRGGAGKPGTVRLRIKSAPRVGQLYWVDFWKDAVPPEIAGEHPGVVIRGAPNLSSPCVIVPITSAAQQPKPYIYQFAKNPNPERPDLTVSALCHHPYTINLMRLRPFIQRGVGIIFPTVSPEELAAIFACMRAAIPGLSNG